MYYTVLRRASVRADWRCQRRGVFWGYPFASIYKKPIVTSGCNTISNPLCGTNRATSFLRFHSFITDPQRHYITDWRADRKLERKWYHSHVNGVLGDVCVALAAAHYHPLRLGEIEEKVGAILSDSSFRERLGNSVMGLGGTRKIDFEYYAFVLAYRRCLHYLAGALASHFKIEASSFRTFPKSIANSTMPDVAKSLREAHARHVHALAFVLAEGRKSVRHRIAHYDFVSAGCVNLTPQGFFLAGGVEELTPPDIIVASLLDRLRHGGHLLSKNWRLKESADRVAMGRQISYASARSAVARRGVCLGHGWEFSGCRRGPNPDFSYQTRTL